MNHCHQNKILLNVNATKAIVFESFSPKQDVAKCKQYKCWPLIESPWCWYTLHDFTLGTKYTVPVIGSFVTAELLLSSCTEELDAL